MRTFAGLDGCETGAALVIVDMGHPCFPLALRRADSEIVSLPILA